MSLITRYAIAVLSFANVAYGMECMKKKNNNAISKLLNHCPGLFDPSSKSYCCLNLNGSDYCCDAGEFALETGLGIIVPAVIVIVVIISLVSLFISCLCCTCCPWYRRRHGGAVYGGKGLAGLA